MKITKSTKKKLVNGSLPDIDSDFANKDRPAVKRYIEERFGKLQVCSVGTYTTFKPKGLLKDLARMVGIDAKESNIISSFIDADGGMLEIIKASLKEPKLKAFIENNTDILFMMSPLLGQVKTQSIHACATIVFPSVITAEEWSPMRTTKGVLISSWGGEAMDDAGFLKLDILGIKQLDKFTEILDLAENKGLNIYDLPYNKEVYRYFSNGWNSDVFQMGSKGLTDYSRMMKPKSFEDLVSTVALYRPGPMNNGYHITYAKCKNEGQKPSYLWGTKNITKDTYGLLIYQEQVMRLFQDLGNLSLLEADDVRRALGKKKLSVLLPWKQRVLEGYLSNGSTEEQFEESWSAIEEFTKYSFNRSHSACYAKASYVCQYLKVKHPLEFWTVALDRASEDDLPNYLSEINQSKAIHTYPPDVNKSEAHAIPDKETMSIFWGFNSIKGIGESPAIQIVTERNKNGKYTSLTNFIERNTFKGSKVKKTTFEALIGCGAFDLLYGFKGKGELRQQLLTRYRIKNKVKVGNKITDPYTIGSLSERWWWVMQQKKLTGLAFFDYRELANSSNFVTEQELSSYGQFENYKTFAGIVNKVIIAKTKRGDTYARLTVEHNYKTFTLLCWGKEYNTHKKVIRASEGYIIVFDANMSFNEEFGNKNQFTLTNKSKIRIL